MAITSTGSSQYPELNTIPGVGQPLGKQRQNQVLEESLVQQAEHDVWREREITTDGNLDCHSWGYRNRERGGILRERAGRKGLTHRKGENGHVNREQQQGKDER